MSMIGGGSSACRRDHLRLWVVTALATGLAVGPLIVLASGPPAGFSGQTVTPAYDCGFGCTALVWQSQSIPAGVNVSFSWSDTSGGRVAFSVELPGVGGPPTPSCLWRNASSGGCYFVSVGGNYSFPVANPQGYPEGSQVVDYSGVYQPSVL